MRRIVSGCVAGAIGWLVVAGCGRSQPPPAPQAPATKAKAAPAKSYALRTHGSAPVPKFTDVLAESGITFQHHFLDSETGSKYRINPYDHGSGVFVADVNGDGWDDIYFLDFLGPNKLYLNKGGWRFEDVTQRAGVAVDRALSVGAAFGDYDNDGDQDLYVTTYRGGNYLFRNHGDATFEDVTQPAGVFYNGHSSTATWFDYDLDGDIDLYVCNIAKFTTETISQEADWFYEGTALRLRAVADVPDSRNPGEPNILWRNNGDGTFTDVASAAGVASAEWNGDATVADIDLDGDLDLYVSNMFGSNHLYRNRGNGTFEEITTAALKRTSWGGMGCKFFDGNGDEYPDLYVVDMHSDMWIVDATQQSIVKPAAKYDTALGERPEIRGKIIEKPDDTLAKTVLFGNTYFENNRDGTFTEKSAEAGLETWWPWGIAVGDYNNDGWEDVFVPSGMGFPYFYWPNHLFLNDGGGKFFEGASRAGIEPPKAGQYIDGAAIEWQGQMQEFARSSRAAAVADFDQDGDLDIVTNNFNHEPYLLRNESGPLNHLRLKVRGTTANRDGFGTRVKLVLSWGDLTPTYSRWVSSAEGYLTQSSSILHIGLHIGPYHRIEAVEVYWPGQKEPQVLGQDQITRIWSAVNKREAIEIVQP